jgi:hypothetical protein
MRLSVRIPIAIALIAASHLAGAATCVWSGTVNGNWSNSLNWGLSCPLGVQDGDALEFPDGAANKALSDDIPNLTVASLNFTGAAGGYTISGAGNLVVSGAAAITSKATGTNANTLSLANAIKFSASTAVIDTTSNADGKLFLNGPLDLNGSTLSFVWDATVPITTVNGVISGDGAISVNGTGGDQGLFLNGNNTFTGPVDVVTGYVVLGHANALGAGGSGANGTTVHPGGTLVLGADVVDEFLTLQGGSGTSGNGILQASANHTWGGPVVLQNTATNNVNLISRTITFAGQVTGTGGLRCCNGLPGAIAFSNPGNTFSGLSDFTSFGGILRLLANDAFSPNSAVVLGGTDGGVLDMQAFSGTIAALTGSPASKLLIDADQTLTVVGAVALGDTQLQVTLAGSPALGTQYEILNKKSDGPSTGTFAGLPEGATLFANGYLLAISYVGGDGNDVTLTVTSLPTKQVVSVLKPGSGSGGVKSDIGSIDCGATCSDTYTTGDVITLTATPDAGSVFTGWLGPCTGTSTCTFTLQGDTAVRAVFAPVAIGTHVLDVDGNGSYDALTDGLMVIRYLFGLTGAPLTNAAIGTGATRSTPTSIESYLGDIVPKLDIDGNGQADALTDGLLVSRALFGVTGTSLVSNAVGPNAIRTTPAAIEAQIQSLTP